MNINGIINLKTSRMNFAINDFAKVLPFSILQFVVENFVRSLSILVFRSNPHLNIDGYPGMPGVLPL